MERDDYITVQRKTLEALISVGAMCLVHPPGSGWTVDPNVQLASTLRRLRAEMAAKKMEGRDCITLKRKPLEELMSAASEEGPMVDILLVFRSSTTGRTEARAG